MTQSPRSGQAAPLDTTPDAVSASRYDSQRSSTLGVGDPAGTWAGSGTNGTSTNGAGSATSDTRPPFVSADSRTGTVPVVTDKPAGSPGVPAGAPGAPAAGRPAGGRSARARGPRRARLQLRHVNPWTVLKFSCVLAIALFFVWLIVVGVLFGVLDAAGVIGKVNHAYTTLKGSGSKTPITASIVFGVAAIIGVVNIILFIALSTIGSVIYNLCADLVGGIEVTLSER